MMSEMRERNLKLFEDVINGKKIKQAADLQGITEERARQIIHKIRRLMMHPLRLRDDVFPEHHCWKITEMRKFNKFWMLQLNKFKNEDV